MACLLQHPSNLLQCICPYQRPHQKLKKLCTPTSIQVCEGTPWSGTGKMSGNLFEDRNWLLPPNYLDNSKENKTENEPKAMTSITSPKPPIKEERIQHKWTTHRKMLLWTRLPLLQISGTEGKAW